MQAELNSVPSLIRAVIAKDGRIKANFSDNTVVLLDASGRTFTYVESTGQQHRQLSEYTLSAHGMKLATAMEFRNSHLDTPFFCKALMKLGKQSFETGFPIRYAAWPACVKDAIAHGLFSSRADGSCELLSEDDTARMVIAAHAKRFAVTFPLQFAVEETPRKHCFVWQTQMFWCSDCPDRWKPALKLALQGQSQGLEGNLVERDNNSSAIAAAAAAEATRGKATAPRTPLPQHSSEVRAEWGAFPKNSWWCECTSMLFPTDVALSAEWRPEAMYHLQEDTREVQVVIHKDRSTLTSYQCGKFFTHHRTPVGMGQLVYAAANPPKQCRSPGGKSNYDLAPIVSHAASFRETAVRLLSSSQRSNNEQPRAGFRTQSNPMTQLSTSVKEVHEDPGTGRFTSYADGRVRAVFSDRAILEMDSDRRLAAITLPDGTQLTVNTSNPIGVEAYVAAAQRFAKWSFSTSEERAAVIRVSRALKMEIENSSRMQDVISWSIDGRIPEGAVISAPTQVEPLALHSGSALADECHKGITDICEGADLSRMVDQYMRINAKMLEKLSTHL